MKKALLIAGGGTLGSYVSQELLRLGHGVEVICLEDNVSNHAHLRFFKERATPAFLERLFRENRYDGIVNFLHFPNADDYVPYHALLSKNTDHLIFLSSYRVYADLQHPITEQAPQWLDTVTDDVAFLQKEDYALAKSRAERFLRDNPYPKNWTVVRPVISFSRRRLDINMVSRHEVIEAAKAGRPVLLPKEAQYLTAGLDWAGNSGKIIAHLLFRPDTVGQAYTVSSGQRLTWDDVAGIYARLLPVTFRWVPADFPPDTWIWYYDRRFDRAVDASKVLAATGLDTDDFAPIAAGVRTELAALGAI